MSAPLGHQCPTKKIKKKTTWRRPFGPTEENKRDRYAFSQIRLQRKLCPNDTPGFSLPLKDLVSFKYPLSLSKHSTIARTEPP